MQNFSDSALGGMVAKITNLSIQFVHHKKLALIEFQTRYRQESVSKGISFVHTFGKPIVQVHPLNTCLLIVHNWWS